MAPSPKEVRLAKLRNKDVYTSGEVALICRCSQQTAIRAIDTGALKGFKVPGSTHRRVLRAELLAYAEKEGLPIDLLQSTPRTDPIEV